LSRLSPKNWIRVIAILIVAVVLVSLAAWTWASPETLSLQPQTSISSSLFQFAKATREFNVTDGEGAYSFLFGIDYNDSTAPGIPTIVDTFVSLVSEQSTSGFLRGVSLNIASASILINGTSATGVKSMLTRNSEIISDRLTGVPIDNSSGRVTISARLIVSVVDVNYIGYFAGNDQIVILNGSISID
jgi:hypothetical protein